MGDFVPQHASQRSGGHPSSLVHTMLDCAVARFGDHAALRNDSRAWTYADLDAQAWRWAQWLHRTGVRRGDRVMTRTRRHFEFVALMFGAFRIGAAVVPINPSMKEFHFGPVLRDAEPTVLVVDSLHDPVFAAAVAGGGPPEIVEMDSAAVAVARLPDTHLITTVLAHDIALLLYTSGTTSSPKAVVCPHSQVRFAADAIAAMLRYRENDVVFCRLPLSFDYGLYQVFLATLAGAEVILAIEGADVGMLRRVRETSATIVPLVPSLATMLTALAQRDRRPTAVRLFTNTGAALPLPATNALRAAFPGAAVSLMYGTTECKRITIMEPDADLDRPNALGRPLPGTEVLIVGSDGQPAQLATVGEIAVRGPHVMSGYWRANEQTARTFQRIPATGQVQLNTGDFGYLDADGYLYFMGRRDELFKRNGVRMSTTEIEAAARDVPGVNDAVALLPGDGHDLELVVVASCNTGTVLRGLAERLEPAKVPQRCVLVAAVPLTANGKPDRKALAALVGRSEA